MIITWILNCQAVNIILKKVFSPINCDNFKSNIEKSKSHIDDIKHQSKRMVKSLLRKECT